MIKTTTTTTIRVTADELKKQLYKAFLDILADNIDDHELFELETNRLTDAMQTIDKHGFTPLFKDSYTMLLLPGRDFDAVEEFFSNGYDKDPDRELEVRVLDNDGNIKERILADDLSY